MPRQTGKPASPLETRLGQLAEECRERARKLPPGIERDQLIRKARQAETASHLSEWATSPGLRPPE